MKHLYFLDSAVLFAALISLPLIAFGYQGAPVKNGGVIEGTITFKGTPPQEPTINVDKNVSYCGKSIQRDWYIVNKKGDVKNAVIMLQNVDKGKPIDTKTIVTWDNKHCMFKPHVAVATVGQTLDIKNSDTILHNTHLHKEPTNRTVYNQPLPFQGVSIKKQRPLAKVGLVKSKCDAHHWMLGWIWVNANPYITKTDAQGHFELKDVPPGTYTLKIWHEKFGVHTEQVTVKANGKAAVNFAFDSALKDDEFTKPAGKVSL